MMRVGFVGWRGMVGSVLMQRMQEENDFRDIHSTFFSTLQAGNPAPQYVGTDSLLQDARDIKVLMEMDVILSCHGGDYTSDIYPKLRIAGWQGHWVDAASTLRMEKDAVIILDPLNSDLIEEAFKKGNKNWIGGNCTVSLMLLALDGLFKKELIEWVSSMTYQAASGAGAQNMRELISQMGVIYDHVKPLIEDSKVSILEIDQNVSSTLSLKDFPIENFGVPLAGSLIPWIDKDLNNGQSKEEWKGSAEVNKILGRVGHPVVIEGLCVRVGVMRCHSQALTIKLKKNISLEEINQIVGGANAWVKLIPNERESSIKELSPAAVSGKLSIPIGRIRKLNMGPEYISAFTVGDQLLWGAAEPLRRILRILIKSI
ncbi:MAG: aspartate-semialdehyde dehydrogenase [Candidatus Methylopumilus sp.]|nr:aspartate-semialdehyde dehydrogenase [Candidatus Methylopumilus sp.]